jgi:Domain of unknown function (DUF4431)
VGVDVLVVSGAMRVAVLLVSLVCVGCGRDPASEPPVITPSSPPPPPSPTATFAPIPSSSPPPAPIGCMPVPWKDDDNAAEATYRGKLTVVEAADAMGRIEKPFVLVLDEPACLPPKGTETKTGEVQIFSGDKKLHEKIESFVGKKIVVTGEGFVSQTAHHHRPIVVDVKTIAPK